MPEHEHEATESDRAKPAHGGVKTKKFAQIVLIYAGLERSELASASAKQKQLIAAVFDALLPSRPWFCPRKPRALPPVSGPSLAKQAALLLLMTSVTAAWRRYAWRCRLSSLLARSRSISRFFDSLSFSLLRRLPAEGLALLALLWHKQAGSRHQIAAEQQAVTECAQWSSYSPR